MLRSREQRQVLLELELLSVTRARAFVPVVTTSPPSSAPPTGDESPAAYWRRRLDEAGTEAEAQELVDLARQELQHLRRRAFAPIAFDDAADLSARVIEDGEGCDPLFVSIALRCTPTFVRRARVRAGRDAERGLKVRLADLDPRALVDAGLSIRQAAVVSGVPRSTLSDRLARATA